MFSLDGYKAALANGGVVRRADRGVLAVAGADRAAWLQGLLTNDVESLKEGESRYAAYLTPQGRMITDMNVIERGGRILLDVPAPLAASLRDTLDGLIFSEDVQVTDESATLWVWTVISKDRFDDVIGETLPAELTALTPLESRHLRGDPHRARRAAVPGRHGRGHHSARGRHRGSRDLVHQGLLRRPGSDRPRHALAAAAASPRSWCGGSPMPSAEIVPLPRRHDLFRSTRTSAASPAPRSRRPSIAWSGLATCIAISPTRHGSHGGVE